VKSQTVLSQTNGGFFEMKKYVVLGLFILAFLLAIIPIGSIAFADTLTYQPGPSQGKDTYSALYSNGTENAYNNSLLRVGGLSSTQTIYSSFLGFNLNGLPKTADKVLLKMYCTQLDPPVTPKPFDIYKIYDSWTESAPPQSAYSGTPTRISALTPLTWVSFDVTALYNATSGASLTKGLWFWPAYWDNGMTLFRSSDHTTVSSRPKLVITATPPVTVPSFKMPLPGGKNWRLTTEIGGTDCAGGTPLASHVGSYHYALDFAPSTTSGSQINVPVYASASGKIVFAGPNSSKPDNGYYVVINHSGYNSETQGFTTRYLHLTSSLLVATGQTISQGDRLGTMGGTGGWPVHLHFGFQYNGAGITKNELTFVKIEGLILKQYQTACNGSSTEGYYASTNTN
jgi:murein DD-endopeptidase MepM/ murein hydrolase activator NlpD